MTPNQNKISRDGMMVAKKKTFLGLGAIAGLILVGLLACAAPVAATEYGWGIQVWSNPSDAYVSVAPMNGGMSWGGFTDSNGSATFETLPAYTWYTVTVTKSGFQPFTQNVYVDMENTKVVNADLQPW